MRTATAAASHAFPSAAPTRIATAPVSTLLVVISHLLRAADDQNRGAGPVGDALGDRAEGLEAMETTAADDEEVGLGGGCDECGRGLVGHVLAVGARDRHGGFRV